MMSRRGFLAAGCAAACAGAIEIAGPSPVHAADATPFRIRVIYSLHAPVQPSPDWPNKGFDFRPVMENINGTLAKECPRFEFVHALATGPEQAASILEADKAAGNIDGYIVYQMNAWNRVIQTIAESGKPVLYADFQFGGSGGFLVYNAAFLRNKSANVGFVASSRMEDLIAAVKCFDIVKNGGEPEQFVAATARARIESTPKQGDVKSDPALGAVSTEDCLRKMKESKILVVRDQSTGDEPPIMGIPIKKITFEEVNTAWRDANKDESSAVADRWQKTAAKVEGVDRATLETSAAMYLGMKNVLKKHGANAITMNCLGGFYGGHIHAYPCLGFYELCNEGLVGACEADTNSTATMTVFTALANGRPGFISDPVIDTSKRQIIYAHCVAPNKVFGPDGETNPFEILTHSEDRQGASVRSILPLGYMTTTLEVHENTREILFHRGMAVANDPDDRACRTKLCADPVGDIEKLFTMWDQWGWHRVTFYGDLKDPVFALAEATGYKVIEEA